MVRGRTMKKHKRSANCVQKCYKNIAKKYRKSIYPLSMQWIQKYLNCKHCKKKSK